MILFCDYMCLGEWLNLFEEESGKVKTMNNSKHMLLLGRHENPRINNVELENQSLKSKLDDIRKTLDT